jgi:hypothetical protein
VLTELGLAGGPGGGSAGGWRLVGERPAELAGG